MWNYEMTKLEEPLLDASSHLHKRVCPSVRMSVNIHEILPESAQSSLKHCGCIPNHYGRIYLPTRACLFYLSFGQTAVTWPKLPWHGRNCRDMAKSAVTWPKLLWPGRNWLEMAETGVTLPKLPWHCQNCRDMAETAVTWPKLPWHGRNCRD